jgi:acetolactate synthase-1/2/3 large subunit
MPEAGSALTGADEMVALLCSKGVDTAFCITGAGNLALVDAIGRDGRIWLVFCHHEQAVVMAAQGYARVSGKVGVALVTTGGGAANAFTGALSAQLDSVPVLLITGNESSFHCSGMSAFRAYGVQGFDAVSAFSPITKFAARIGGTDEIEQLFDRAWGAAASGRQGVSLLDFPMDLQRKAVAEPVVPPVAVPSSPAGAREGLPYAAGPAVSACAVQLTGAARPLLYFGNGLRGEGATALAVALAERLRIPFFMSWSAIDLVEDAHPLNMGRVGIYGDRAANIILQQSDFILCVGTRLAIPQVGYDQGDFARQAERWVVDVDPVELSKFVGPRWNLVEADATTFLSALSRQLEALDPLPDGSDWLDRCSQIWAALPRDEQTGPDVEPEAGFVHSSRVMERLNVALDADAVIVTDVGAGLLSGHYTLRPRPGQRVFTSQGLGEMGFGLPGAIGASFAAPGRQIVCLSTDGGIMFNLQELQTARQARIPLKLFVFNNAGYSMIRISQDNLFEGRQAGIDADSGVSFPDFESVAATFGFAFCRIESEAGLDSLLPSALASPDAVLIEVRMSPHQRYLPRLGTRKLADGSLTSPPLEDLDPYLELEELERLLGAKAHPNSYRSRGIPDA